MLGIAGLKPPTFESPLSQPLEVVNLDPALRDRIMPLAVRGMLKDAIAAELRDAGFGPGSSPKGCGCSVCKSRVPVRARAEQLEP
jgi:hypothetical protein